MKKYVLTGSACCGKTEVINELKNKGYSILEETARPILEERINFKVTKEEITKRQELIFKKQLEEEKSIINSKGNTIFLDRSLIDVIAYCLFYLKDIPKEIKIQEIFKKNYNLIFLLDRFPFRNDGIRIEENDETAAKIQEKLKEVYQRFGYNLIEVPIMNLQERVNFILLNTNKEITDKITENYRGEDGLHRQNL